MPFVIGVTLAVAIAVFARFGMVWIRVWQRRRMVAGGNLAYLCAWARS